jgi:F0F1-type ATP synthase membrane subunit b/b'
VKRVISGGIFAFFLLLAFASKFILGFTARIFTKKTKTIIDDRRRRSAYRSLFLPT